MNVVGSTELQLVITDGDLPAGKAQQIRAQAGGTQLLGGESERALFDALPSAIARRVQNIVPKDFVISELELKMTLNGTVCGVGISGDVVVKLAPAPKA